MYFADSHKRKKNVCAHSHRYSTPDRKKILVCGLQYYRSIHARSRIGFAKSVYTKMVRAFLRRQARFAYKIHTNLGWPVLAEILAIQSLAYVRLATYEKDAMPEEL